MKKVFLLIPFLAAFSCQRALEEMTVETALPVQEAAVEENGLKQGRMIVLFTPGLTA